jgi:hypothetical protein
MKENVQMYGGEPERASIFVDYLGDSCCENAMIYDFTKS